ncbi:MAG: protein-disulfide reductase DsbD domain-containing protein [Actinomycetota bacterium]
MRQLVLRFELPDGLHIYDEPVPSGMVATSVEIEAPDGVRFEPMMAPPTRRLELPGLADPLQVWDGSVDLVVPFFANSGLVPLLKAGETSIAMTISVRYQACDDERCFLPRTHTLEVAVPIGFGVMPGFDGLEGRGATVVEMDSTSHMRRLLQRTADPDGGPGGDGHPEG